MTPLTRRQNDAKKVPMCLACVALRLGLSVLFLSMFAGVDPPGFNAQNPVATNPAHFMDPTANRFLYGMASALDVFILWNIVLMGIGFACNSKAKRSTSDRHRRWMLLAL